MLQNAKKYYETQDYASGVFDMVIILRTVEQYVKNAKDNIIQHFVESFLQAMLGVLQNHTVEVHLIRQLPLQQQL